MADRRDALIIATGAYEHDGLRDLRSAAADATALAGVLQDPGIGGFAVDVLRDGSAHEVRSRVEDFFADRQPSDLLLLHLSCHGLKSESGDLYFTARDTRPQRLASTAISADFVQHCLRMSRSRSIVVLLDCCYGGAFAKGVRVRAAGDIPVMDSFPVGRGRAVITASSAMEYAFEGDELADDNSPTPSVFTSALVEGLRTGEADLDGDGLISLDELYDYVFDRVRERNPAQTPTKNVEMSGDLFLARSRRRRRLPDELLAALAEPNVFTRLGAVSGLRELLLGKDVQLAAVARRELERIAGGDLPQVSEPARAALRELVLVPSTRMIELTEQTPTCLVRLDGPPITRSGSWKITDPRIQVRPVPDGLEVSVPPGVALRGEIRLTSIAGDLTIPVVASRVSAPRSAPTPTPPPRRPSREPVTEPPDPGRFTGQLWPGQAPVAVLYAIVGLVLGFTVVGGTAPTNSWFGYGILAYAVLRLIESFRTDIGAIRRRCVWGLCGLGLLAGIWVFSVHMFAPAVLFWLVAAVVEFFGRPLDRVRAVAMAAVAATTLIVASNSGSNSSVDHFLNGLSGMLPIALGLITLAPLLIPRFR
ncbi:caspase family protein [Kutzneria buriramensis]|uniref:Caspase domain-containing protein n=1 Tax=Kutzneria buriramensis TaxID=1045776 RepID=A0A3E0H3P5_9PSEU|nr:caspase family protein [Kutzneria buriramensis]REH37168.1 caspase domain-containing protein [Kutzneria buriramensis]